MSSERSADRRKRGALHRQAKKAPVALFLFYDVRKGADNPIARGGGIHGGAERDG